MHKLFSVLVLLTATVYSSLGWAADFRSVATPNSRNPVVLAGGMGGGGRSGMTGGGMGGMGGMGAGIGGMGAGAGYGFSPGSGFGRTDTATDSGGGGAQPAQYYLCVTPYDRCSLAASPGSLRSG